MYVNFGLFLNGDHEEGQVQKTMTTIWQPSHESLLEQGNVHFPYMLKNIIFFMQFC